MTNATLADALIQLESTKSDLAIILFAFESRVPDHPWIKRGHQGLEEVKAFLSGNAAPGGALAAILAERERQISKGYDAAHDDQHVHREIICAPHWGVFDRILLWSDKGDEGYRRSLIEAAAMIVAEIERVDRANAKQEG